MLYGKIHFLCNEKEPFKFFTNLDTFNLSHSIFLALILLVRPIKKQLETLSSCVYHLSCTSGIQCNSIKIFCYRLLYFQTGIWLLFEYLKKKKISLKGSSSNFRIIFLKVLRRIGWKHGTLLKINSTSDVLAIISINVLNKYSWQLHRTRLQNVLSKMFEGFWLNWIFQFCHDQNISFDIIKILKKYASVHNSIWDSL